MADKTVFGWIASSITIIYKLPQIYKLYNTKSSKDLSILSIIIQTFGYIFYAIHGWIIQDLPVLFMGTVAFVENVIMGIMYFWYKNTVIDEN